MTDDDIPEVGEEWFRKAKLRLPPRYGEPMKIDTNYFKATVQVSDKTREALRALATTLGFMLADQPQKALDSLEEAKAAVEGAMVSARWANTLPVREEQ